MGDLYHQITYGDKWHFIARFLYDYILFAVINVIMVNIFNGIIVDTYAEIIEKTKRIEEEMKRYCPICSIEFTLFEKHTPGF